MTNRRSMRRRLVAACVVGGLAMASPTLATLAPGACDVTAVAGGAAHGLAVRADGSVWSWGWAFYGQLGNGTSGAGQSLTIPARIDGLSDVVAVASGQVHSMGLRADGTVLAWGDNSVGQLGNGTNSRATRPVPVLLPGPARAIAAGDHHSLFVLADGRLFACGLGELGAIGDGGRWNRNSPVEVAGLPPILAVAGGGEHSLAVGVDGSAWAWGDGSHGQLGDGRRGGETLSTVPVRVQGLAGVVAVAAGEAHSLALTASGEIWAWGDGTRGQIGDGSAGSDVTRPVRVASLAGATAIAAKDLHSLAVLADGSLWGWGQDSSGQLGLQLPRRLSPSFEPLPQRIEIPGHVVNVASASTTGFALMADGRLQSWGNEDYGSRGDGSVAGWDEREPRLVALPCDGCRAQVVESSGGNAFSLALRADGTVFAWGRGDRGQIGDGARIRTSQPVQVPDAAARRLRISSVLAGPSRHAALRADGVMLAWGGNSNDLLGVASTGDVAQPEPIVRASLVQVAWGSNHALGVTSAGILVAWGVNANGQLGDGTLVDSATPVTVGLTDVTSFDGGDRFSVAVSGGRAYTWGWGATGRLGRTGGPTESPAEPVGLPDVTAVAAGNSHALALAVDGTVWSWGYDAYGQLGDGTPGGPFGSQLPAPVPGIVGARAVAADWHTSYALLDDGTLLSWGNNEAMLGDGNWNARSVPGPVLVPGPVVDFGVGGASCLALLADGRVFCWGTRFGSTSATVRTPKIVTWPTDTPVPVIVDVADGGVAVDAEGRLWHVMVGAEVERDGALLVPLTGAHHATRPIPVSSISAGGSHALAVTAEGVVGWGAGDRGQLTGSSDLDVATVLTEASLARAVAAGAAHSYGLRPDGTVEAWGEGSRGQLGDGRGASSDVPVEVIGLPPVRCLASGDAHGLVVADDGSAWGWGAADRGQLGAGVTPDALTPLPVPGLADVIQVAAGRAHSLAVRGDGAVLAWGAGDRGQLGQGDRSDRGAPVLVSGLPPIVGVAAGGDASMARGADGSAWVWGAGDRGQAGNGSSVDVLSPTRVNGMDGVSCVDAGAAAVQVVLASGSLLSWGGDDEGQVGDGDPLADQPSPIAIDAGIVGPPPSYEPSALDIRPSVPPLLVAREGATSLVLTWEATPGTPALALAGTLAGLRSGTPNHSAAACNVVDAEAVIAMPSLDSYLLVAASCGSVGRDSMGIERPLPLSGPCP